MERFSVPELQEGDPKVGGSIASSALQLNCCSVYF